MNKLSFFLLVSSLFLSACSSGPFIVDPTPADGSTVYDSTIVITFRVAQPIDIRSFNETSLRIYGSKSGPFKVNARYSPEKQEVRIVILDSLQRYEYVDVVITDLVRLKDGGRIPKGAKWRFVTLPPKLENDTSVAFLPLDELPEIIGGIAEIHRKLVYPEAAKRSGIEGTVYIQALVDESGRVYQTTVMRGIGGGCDEAAAEAVRNARFKPAVQKGKPVKFKMSIPIRFRLSR